MVQNQKLQIYVSMFYLKEEERKLWYVYNVDYFPIRENIY